MSLLFLLLLVALIYIIAVFLIVLLKTCKVNEAQSIIFNFLRECFRSNPAPKETITVFPVFFGLTENGTFEPNIIEEIFKKLLKVFDVYYPQNVIRDSEQFRILYIFKVGKIRQPMTDLELHDCVQMLCESIIYSEIRYHNPTFPTIPNICSVRIHNSELFISIAIQKTGLQINARQTFFDRRKLKEVQIGVVNDGDILEDET